ncbi:MAG: DNA repair exonuclease [Candidatus Korarchaeota archaeon]|nr:DNA repair exonuclease [Candidatus Korarchaeota archaeon]
MRIVHMSDNHLGKAQFHLAEREEDLYKAFDMAVDLALQQDPDLVIHTGDLFDSYRPHPRAFVRAFEGLLRIVERDIPIAIVEGNHELGPDTVRKRIASPLINLRKLFERLGYGKLFVRLGPGAVRIGDVVVAGAPYASRGVKIADTVESLDRKAKNLCESCPKVLMLHQGVRGMIKAIYPEVDFSEIAKSSFDYVAMGHYHNKVVRRSGKRIFAYSGSTEVIETREIPLAGEGKYVLSVKIDKGCIEMEELRLRTRPFLYFSETLINTQDLYVLIEGLKKQLTSQEFDERPVVYGKLSLKGDVRTGMSTLEIRRALMDLSLYVIVRESRITEEGEEKGLLTGVGLEELVQNAVASLDLDQEVRALALRIFDLWYREGKRGEAFVNGVLGLMEEGS